LKNVENRPNPSGTLSLCSKLTTRLLFFQKNKSFVNPKNCSSIGNMSTKAKNPDPKPPGRQKIDRTNLVPVYEGTDTAAPGAKVTINRALMTQTLGVEVTNSLLGTGSSNYQRVISAMDSCFYRPPPAEPVKRFCFDSDEDDFGLVAPVGTLKYFDETGAPY
jgi:hypothetical protein